MEEQKRTYTIFFQIIFLSLFIYLFLINNTFAQDRLNLNRNYPVLEAENKVWIGTENGLYQYNADDDSYKLYTLPIDGYIPKIHHLYYNDEWLWCVLDSGLAALHIRLNDWLIYNSQNGLPSNKINTLAFEEDYVWASTDKGAARYDLLIEEWEIYDQSRDVPALEIQDVLIQEEEVWMMFKHKFSEYNPEFEKWRHYQIEQDTTLNLKRSFFLNDEIWLLSDNGLIRYNTTVQTQQTFFLPYLESESLLELFIEDETIWAITKLGIFYYTQESEVWREFEGNSYLDSYTIKNAYVDKSEIWVLTNEAVLVWDRTEKNWEILDYASGLSASNFQSAYVSGNRVFLFNPDKIEYRQYAEDSWRQYEIASGDGKLFPAGSNVLKNLFDNEEGGSIQLGKYKWGWEGTSITMIREHSEKFDSEGKSEGAETISGERLDIKSQLSLGKTRTLSGFYNNYDYEETMYGIRYRSREDDYLREFNWGDFRREPGDIPFGETSSLFGNNVWLQAGSKTERFKRSLVTLKAYSGERRSQKFYEHYQGATTEFDVSFKDIDFTENRFYSVPGLDTSGTPQNVQIYVDDLVSYNNTPNTNEQTTIAGITGDFDLLNETEDFYFYDKAGVIYLTGFYNSSATIVVRYTTQNQVNEEILQIGSTISTAQKNFYFLDGQQIIPYSFQLEIVDNSGNTASLSQFGLDDDGNGIIDSRWIDYENGILFFPESEPFPSGVYDPDQPESSYQLEASFQTEFSIIQLEHDDLVRGTEVVKLDGVAAEGGNDYVLDYTNGTMVFVREGVVNMDTRIEIEYEYYVTEETSQLHSAAVNYSPSDNLYVQADWTNFASYEDETSTPDSTKNLLSVHSEIKEKVGDFDLKVIPGIAYQTEENEISASSVEGLVSSSKFRFQTKYENYSKDYSNIYRPQSLFGDVKNNLELFSSADVLSYLRLSGEWKKTEGFEQNGYSSPTDESWNLSLLMHRQDLPGWKLSYQNFKTETETGTVERFFVRNNLEYQLPQSLVQGIGLKTMKAEAFLRYGEESGTSYAGVDKQQFYFGYLRLNTNISDQFQGSIYYRRNEENDISGENQNSKISRSERMLFNLSHEEWRLLQMNLRIENTLDQGFHNSQSSINARLNQYSQLNLRMSPGQMWSVLSPLHFEFNVNQSLYGWGTTEETVSNWVWQLFNQNTDRLSQSQIIRNYYIKNEFRPSSLWYLYSLIEWNNQETGLETSNLETNYWNWNEKLNIKIGFKTRLNLQYKQHYQDYGYDRITRYYEPSAWIEHRWTPDFQNTLYGLYRYTKEDEGNIQDITNNWEGRYDIIFRKTKYWGIRRFEITQSFSGSYYNTEGYNLKKYYQFSSSSALNLYPLHSTILRLQFDAVQYLDDLDADNDYMTLDFNLKFSLKF